jgi:hypothetical protein
MLQKVRTAFVNECICIHGLKLASFNWLINGFMRLVLKNYA